MDQKEAFRIMGLDVDVSLEEAKKAYRVLAKKNHPDLIGINQTGENNAEAKMKDINLAFRYLAPLLKSKKKPRDDQIKKRDKASERPVNLQKSKVKVPGKKRMADFLLKLLDMIFTGFPDKTTAESYKENLKKTATGSPPKMNPLRFGDVLKTVHHTYPHNESQKNTIVGKRNLQKINTGNGYQTYMMLKKKMKSGRSARHRNMDIGKIEKIEPIRPVSPVNRH